VLIFLEAQALGRPLPNFALHLAQDLLVAGRTLGLRALEVGVMCQVPDQCRVMPVLPVLHEGLRQRLG
jgi:hypothetical protein